VKFVAGRDETATESRQIITIGVSNTFDEVMKSQPSEDASDLSAGFVWQECPEAFVAEPVDGKLTTQDGE